MKYTSKRMKYTSKAGLGKMELKAKLHMLSYIEISSFYETLSFELSALEIEKTEDMLCHYC